MMDESEHRGNRSPFRGQVPPTAGLYVNMYVLCCTRLWLQGPAVSRQMVESTPRIGTFLHTPLIALANLGMFNGAECGRWAG